MRKETFGIGTYVHVMSRGARNGPIVRDEDDRWRFIKLLRYLNDDNTPRNWERDVSSEHVRSGFVRPDSWRAAKPYVSLLAYCLMDNHFHLLVREREEGGISTFMQRLCLSMASYFNAKYEEKGALFQGSYNARVVTEDSHLQYLATYIQVKNSFERHPRGLKHAIGHFDEAFLWAEQDPFNSLADYSGKRRSLLIDHEAVNDVFPNRRTLHKIAKEIMHDAYLIDNELESLLIDEE